MKKLLIILTIATVAILLLMIAKNEYARFLPSPGYGMSEIIQTKKIDHLFLGASTFRKGLDIEEISTLPGNSYILSYNGNQPIMMHMILEYLLDQGVTIDHLYVDFYPYISAAKPALSDTRILLDTDIAFKIRLWQKLHPNGYESLQDIHQRMSEGYEMFVSSNNSTLFWWPLHQRINRSRNIHGGLRNMQQDHGRSQADLDNLEGFGKRDGVQASQIEAFKKIIELSKQNHIQLTFLEIPTYHKMYDDPDYQEIFGQIHDALADTSELSIIFARQIPLNRDNPDYFSDLVHMSGFGAHTYTKMLVSTLNH